VPTFGGHALVISCSLRSLTWVRHDVRRVRARTKRTRSRDFMYIIIGLVVSALILTVFGELVASRQAV
jgi:membrane-associated PAP2 superfamily phosphatase